MAGDMADDASDYDKAMAGAAFEIEYDGEIRSALTDICGTTDGDCFNDYYCKPNGVWCCKKCGAEYDG